MNIHQAMELVEARKQASLGEAANTGVVVGMSEFQDRAVFSGFDIDHEELVEVMDTVANYFTSLSPITGLYPLFGAAWIDGFLTGLLLAQANVVHESGT